MRVKEKPCKGQGRAKDFGGCGKCTPHRKFGLCRSCLYLWGRSTKAGKEWFDSQVFKVMKRRLKEKDRELKESMKSIQRLIQDAREPFQRWIRLRDANDACISCGYKDSDLWDAGHFFKAELFTGLIFSEINCNKQCRKCNRFLDGNESGYRIGLVKKYGEKTVRELEEAANHLRTYKFTREELKAIKKKYQDKLKTQKNV